MLLGKFQNDRENNWNKNKKIKINDRNMMMTMIIYFLETHLGGKEILINSSIYGVD